MELNKHSEDIWTISEFLEDSICKDLIEEMEKSGYYEEKESLLSESLKFDLKNRLFFKSDELATLIWENLMPFAPKYHNTSAIGVNEEFRLYKYFTGQTFESHKDSPCIRNEKERSFYSLLIYFNDDFQGGETVFDTLSIKPTIGTAVIFPHTMSHYGATVTDGFKYILRSDIMYQNAM